MKSILFFIPGAVELCILYLAILIASLIFMKQRGITNKALICISLFFAYLLQILFWTLLIDHFIPWLISMYGVNPLRQLNPFVGYISWPATLINLGVQMVFTLVLNVRVMLGLFAVVGKPIQPRLTLTIAMILSTVVGYLFKYSIGAGLFRLLLRASVFSLR
ncbi:hypothetical protein JW872_01375 [Candidatus Babeliales bacterium]|nr:hypothetical protein [Candidatus Babeliales bacterium]